MTGYEVQKWQLQKWFLLRGCVASARQLATVVAARPRVGLVSGCFRGRKHAGALHC